jgi:hypothetical protein
MRRNALIQGMLQVLCLFALAAVAPESSAMWAKLTDSELLQKSDSIVIGEVIGQTELVLALPATRLTLAVIRVDEVLKGDKRATVVLLETPSSAQPRSGSDILYGKGQSGVWFLRLRSKSESGVYRADHPQRFQSLNEAARLIKMLRDQSR